MARKPLPSSPGSWVNESLLLKTHLLKLLKLLRLPGMGVAIWHKSHVSVGIACVLITNLIDALDMNMWPAAKLRLWCLSVLYLDIENIP